MNKSITQMKGDQDSMEESRRLRRKKLFKILAGESKKLDTKVQLLLEFNFNWSSEAAQWQLFVFNCRILSARYQC